MVSFSYVTGEIRNLHISGTITKTGNDSNTPDSLGAIVNTLGYGSSHEAPGTCRISNCENSGSLVCDFLSGGMVGGIAGRVNDGLIKGCMNEA